MRKLTITSRPMNSRPPNMFKHISQYNDGYTLPFRVGRQESHEEANGHNFQQPPPRRN